MSTPLPEKFDDFSIRLAFFVAQGQTVRPGFPVKITGYVSGSLEKVEVQEALLVTDLGIGVAQGALGVNGPGPIAAGAEVNVILLGQVADRMIAGTAGVTIGQRVMYSSTGVVTATTPNAAGTISYESPGIALNSAAVGKAASILLCPATFLA